jgi:hypothetical protein
MKVSRSAGFVIASVALIGAVVLTVAFLFYEVLFSYPATTEALDANTKLLLHMDGSNGSTVFTDSSLTPKTMTAFGNAQITTAQSKFSGASGVFDGTGDYLTTPASADFSFGTGNFTVDFWVRKNGTQSAAGIVGTRNAATSTNWSLEVLSDKVWVVRDNIAVFGAANSLSNLTWTHVALVRFGNTLTLYQDGVSQGSVSVTGQTWNSGDGVLVVGRNQSDVNANYLNGWLDEMRITKGVALWTSGFTPPDAPDTGSGTPSAPGTPTFTTVTQTSMRVNWTAAPGASNYKIERCAGVGCSSFTQIVSGVSALYYDDSGLSAGTSYSYRIRGTNASGDGTYSGTGTQVTGATPGTPGTPTFSSVTAVSMRVNWTAASGASSYKIERCVGAGCSIFTQLATGISTLYFDDAALTPSTSYSYRVRATNAQGDGSYSGTGSQSTAASGGGAAIPITGWAWSDTIGWIDLNCSNLGVCGSNSFGLSADTVNGTLSGYAWSDNVGWISANSSDLSGCPSAPCTATLGASALSGWLKAVSGGSAQSGGWDGYIALSDTDTGDGFSYGVSYGAGNFSGYGWGSTNVGWVDFSLAHTTYNTCTPSTTYTCSDSVTIVRTVTTAECQTTVTSPYIMCVAPQFCSTGSPVCITPEPTPEPGAGGLTGNLTVKPNLVGLNGTTTVYWAVNNVQVNSCAVTADDGSSSWSGEYSATSTCPTKYATGCTSLPIVKQTTFRLSCLDFDGNNYVETATVNLVPIFEENCNTGFIHVNGQCVRP